MKTNKNTRQHRPTPPTPTRPGPRQATPPPAPRPGCEFLDFCLYPGMKPETTTMAYPTAV
jgi:hypothetical protein